MTNEYLEAAIVDPGDECIEWPYGTNGVGDEVGYGRFKADGKDCYAHIVALELTTPRPAGKVCSIKKKWVEGSKLVAAHGPCHNTLCFNPRHLSWKTAAENAGDKKRDGTNNDGERNGLCTVPSDVVDQIFAKYKGRQHWKKPKTGPTLEELGEEFGISKQHVSKILRGERRKVA